MVRKDIKKDMPKEAERPASNVNSYFTKEIVDQMATMSTKEMEATLKQMIGSREFMAILKYTGMRTPLLDATLRSTDPVKDPSKISWCQGCAAGLDDLATYVIDLNAPKPAEEQEGESTESNPGSVIIG